MPRQAKGIYETHLTCDEVGEMRSQARGGRPIREIARVMLGSGHSLYEKTRRAIRGLTFAGCDEPPVPARRRSEPHVFVPRDQVIVVVKGPPPVTTVPSASIRIEHRWPRFETSLDGGPWEPKDGTAVLRIAPLAVGQHEIRMRGCTPDGSMCGPEAVFR